MNEDTPARIWPWFVALGAALAIVGAALVMASRPSTTATPPTTTLALSDSVFVPNGVERPSDGSVVWELDIPIGAKAYGAQVFDSMPTLRGRSSTVVLVDVGDEIVITNEDDIVHYIGPFIVRPGETLRHTFTDRGTLLSGSCSFVTDTVTFNVSA